MTTLDEVHDGWDQAAQQDAMTHILTKGSSWDPEEFFTLGREEIRIMLDHVDGLGLRGKRRKDALDFGCGVGRLTVALADHYEQVVGVDISESMIDQAREHPNVTYFCSRSLEWVPARSVDLVYTNLVLQHMPREIAHPYIAEFIRVLHKDGLAVFEIPAGPDYSHSVECLSMWGTEPEAIEELVSEAGGRVVDRQEIYTDPMWRTYRYTAALETASRDFWELITCAS